MIEILLTPDETKAARAVYHVAKNKNTNQNRAQCRKLLGVLKEPCEEHEESKHSRLTVGCTTRDGVHHPSEERIEYICRADCPKCMAKIERILNG